MQNFTIERILDLKKDQGRIMCLIKLSGFEELDNTWEPLVSIYKDAPNLVAEFLEGSSLERRLVARAKKVLKMR